VALPTQPRTDNSCIPRMMTGHGCAIIMRMEAAAVSARNAGARKSKKRRVASII